LQTTSAAIDDCLLNVKRYEKIPGRENEKATFEYALHRSFPNPANPSTVIEFEIAEPGHVTLKVFNLLGEEVLEVAKGDYAAGRHRAFLDAAPLASGVYFYRIVSGSFVASEKFMVLK